MAYCRYILVGRQKVDTEHLANGNEDNYYKCCHEDVNGILGVLWNLLVECGCVRAVDVCILFRVTELSLEFRVFVKVQSTVPTIGYSTKNTEQTGRNGDHDYLHIADIEPVVDRYC